MKDKKQNTEKKAEQKKQRPIVWLKKYGGNFNRPFIQVRVGSEVTIINEDTFKEKIAKAEEDYQREISKKKEEPSS